MKTTEQLRAELAASICEMPEDPAFPKSQFIEAALALIEAGRATWDGQNLILIEGRA
jgi:predicted GNAT superfamily acetyltransferase